jgi:glycine/D-amino acid oxidase-like deaminating enzyme
MAKRNFVTGWDEQDIITWILRKVCDRLPAAGTAILEVEMEARNHWGGMRPYVGKRRPITDHGGVPKTTFYHRNDGAKARR